MSDNGADKTEKDVFALVKGGHDDFMKLLNNVQQRFNVMDEDIKRGNVDKKPYMEEEEALSALRVNKDEIRELSRERLIILNSPTGEFIQNFKIQNLNSDQG